jgi:tRNA(Glu) U13 pseudouridine synthase TruD
MIYGLIDNWVKSSPANRRAVLMTVEALRKEGHEVSEFTLPNGMYADGP